MVYSSEYLASTRPSPIVFESMAGRQSAVVDIDREAFPEQYRAKSTQEVDQRLQEEGALSYSFVAAKTAAGQERAIGYCLAHILSGQLADQLIVGQYSTATLLINSLAVRPHNGEVTCGPRMFNEILSRAEAADIGRIAFMARESTSYRMFTSPLLSKRINKAGYHLQDYGTLGKASRSEKINLIELTRLHTPSQVAATLPWNM